jgi:hypothetical protein
MRTTTATSLTVRVPLTIRHRPGRKTVITPAASPDPALPAAPVRADPALIKALARAHRWKRLLESGRCASLGELAAGEKLDRGYLGRILQLTLLAPDLVEAMLDGRQPVAMSLPQLISAIDPDWSEQRRRFAAPEGLSQGHPHEPHHLYRR